MTSDEPYRFVGFDSPNYTPVPDVIFDELAPELTEAELRVLLYIVRRTFGFKKSSDGISLTQLVSGIKTRDGRILDRGTGMSRPGVTKGVKGLIDKEVIIVDKTLSDDGVNQTNVYRLHFRDASQGVVNDVTYGSQPGFTEPAEVVNGVDYGTQHGYLGVGNDVNPQETVQETEEQETAIEDSIGWSRLTINVNDRIAIGRYVEDLARELRDQASLGASTTRACRIYLRSRKPLDDFLTNLLEARRRTQEHSGNIKMRVGTGPEAATTKMAYFFSVLEDLVGAKGSPRS